MTDARYRTVVVDGDVVSLVVAESKAQKQVDRVPGEPLERWGDRQVVITPEDVARAIREFNERVPEAAGLLDPREG